MVESPESQYIKVFLLFKTFLIFFLIKGSLEWLRRYNINGICQRNWKKMGWNIETNGW